MNHKVNKLVYASLFLALALALPFLTGQIPQIGAMLTLLVCLRFGPEPLACPFPEFYCSL